MPPASTTMMATTDAKIGRVMKKLTIYGWRRAKQYLGCCI